MADTEHRDWILANVPRELINSSLFKFNVKLQVVEKLDDNNRPVYKVITVDMLANVDIDYETLEESICDIPSQFAFLSAVYSEVRLGVAIAERKLKIRRAEATRAVLDEAKKNTVKLTVDQIKSIVEADELLNKAEVSYSEIQMKAGKLYNMVEAIKMKAELARTLAGFKKLER
jgi:hypothetical protein